MKSISKKGIFLGYKAGTLENIVWWDPETENVKYASHARFDEGMNDLPISDIPPNVQHLQRIEEGNPIPAETVETSIEEFHLYSNPFAHTLPVSLKAKNCKNANFGMSVSTDEINNRAYVSAVKKNSSIQKAIAASNVAAVASFCRLVIVLRRAHLVGWFFLMCRKICVIVRP